MDELLIEVGTGGSGHVAVRDYGGAPEAVPVLLVHTLGTCAVTWDLVASHLGPSVHAYAVDLPGHGHSTAAMARPQDAWAHLAAVVRELGLDRPLLVAVDQSSFLASVAMRSDPDLYRGLLTIGGMLFLDTEAAAESVTFARSDAFAELLKERFFFGVTGTTSQEADALVDELVARRERDWLLPDLGTGLRQEVQWSIRTRPDGSWLHVPEPESVLRQFDLPQDDPDFPGPHFYDPVTAPVWFVQLRGGHDPIPDADLARIEAHPLLRLAELDAGSWPQYEAPAQVAALVEHVALDPASAPPVLDGEAR